MRLQSSLGWMWLALTHKRHLNQRIKQRQLEQVQTFTILHPWSSLSQCSWSMPKTIETIPSNSVSKSSSKSRGTCADKQFASSTEPTTRRCSCNISPLSSSTESSIYSLPPWSSWRYARSTSRLVSKDRASEREPNRWPAIRSCCRIMRQNWTRLSSSSRDSVDCGPTPASPRTAWTTSWRKMLQTAKSSRVRSSCFRMKSRMLSWS